MPPITVSERQAYLVTVAAGLSWLFDSVIVNILTVALRQLAETFKLTAVNIGVISSLSCSAMTSGPWEGARSPIMSAAG